MSKNDLTMAYAFRAPRGVSRAEALKEIREAIDRDGELPPGYGVQWRWRNTAAQDMRETDLATAITESRDGFVALMRRRLDRDIARAELAELQRRLEQAPPAPPRKRSRADAAKAGWQKRKAKKAALSGRARKGWATKRVRAAQTTRARKGKGKKR